MTYARTRAQLSHLTLRAIQPGLARTRILLSALDFPAQSIPAVQVTGSNGKGSVVALIASALTAAGYRVGAYTSPHLEDERERIAIAGRKLTPAQFVAAADPLLPALRALRRAGNPATTFEAWTVLAAQAFARAEVEIAVLEVGLGGRLDATSAWQRVILSILTHVSLEHTRELGPDLFSICREKLGLARTGVPLISAETDPGLRALIRDRGRERNFPVAFAGRDSACLARVEDGRRTKNGVRFGLRLGPIAYPGLRIGLRGVWQIDNGALSVLALSKLAEAGFPVPEKAMRRGFQGVSWPGRMERVAVSPQIFLDGAHNPAAAAAVAQEMLATRGKVHLVAGMMADKDVAGVVKALAPAAREVWTLCPPDARGLPAADLAAWFRDRGVPAHPERSSKIALARAIAGAGPRGTILVVGSLYNIAGARRALKSLGISRGKSRRPGG